MPETLEEFENMLCYFRDHDMNGNGDASDEIPYRGCAGMEGIFTPLEASFPLIPLPAPMDAWREKTANANSTSTPRNFGKGLRTCMGCTQKGCFPTRPLPSVLRSAVGTPAGGSRAHLWEWLI